MLQKLLFIGLLISSITATAQKKNYQVTAVAFYNFENLFDTKDDPKNWGDDEFLPAGPYHYDSTVYNQKLHNLATVLQQLGTDVTPDGPAIIGTAEIENDQVLTDLTNQPEIKQRHYKFVHFESPDSRGIDVAMLYNPRYFTVISAEPLNVNISQSGEKGGNTRDVLHVHGILAGDSVHVFVNHWPSRRGGESASAPLRAIAARVDKRVVDSIMAKDPRQKVIVMGDLNDDPTDASIAKVLGAKGNKEDVKEKELYNPWVTFYNKGIGTLGYQDKWDLFDQIMISGNWLKAQPNHWNYYKAEVFNREFLKTRYGQYKGYPHRSFDGNLWINGYSDHFPTILFFVKEQV